MIIPYLSRHVITCLEVNAAYSNVSNLQKSLMSLNYGGERPATSENQPAEHITLTPDLKSPYLSGIRREVHETIIAASKDIESLELDRAIFYSDNQLDISIDGCNSDRNSFLLTLTPAN